MGNSPSLGRDRSRSISRTGGLLVLFEDGIAAPLSSSKRPSSPQRVVVRRARRRTGRHEEVASLGIIAAVLVPLREKGLCAGVSRAVKLVKQGSSRRFIVMPNRRGE